MHGPTVGSYGRPLSYERGTPVGCKHGLVGVSAGCSWGVGCRVKGPGLRALRGRGADDGGVRNLRGGVGGSRHLVREVEHDFRRRDVSLRVGVAVDVGVLVRVARVGGPGPAGWASGFRVQGLERTRREVRTLLDRHQVMSEGKVASPHPPPPLSLSLYREGAGCDPAHDRWLRFHSGVYSTEYCPALPASEVTCSGFACGDQGAKFGGWEGSRSRCDNPRARSFGVAFRMEGAGFGT